MEPIVPIGHRRRRSSLATPANASSSRRRSPRPRAQSIRTQANGIDEPKISEEDSEMVALRGDGADSDSLSDEDLHDDEETGLTGKDKRRKRQKRRRNTRLDQRIAREKLSAEEKKVADRNVLRRLLVNATLIGLWYFFSLCISLYNKWMFDPSKLNFPFPMFTTAVHMLVQFSLASLVLFIVPSLRPQNGHVSDLGQSRHEMGPEKPVMSKMFYLTRIGPCGMATGLDIGLGNTSLQFITLTFYTMCKSSSLAFVLIFAFVFRLETPTWRLVGIIATMTLGVIMMVAGEVEFKLGGFLLVISAAFFSGFRWGLTQILLLRNPATSNPFASIFFLAPVMFLTLITIAIPVEGIAALVDGVGIIIQEKGVWMTPLLILFPGVIAFLMTASEFALLQRTSVVTLSIAGIFKEAVTISAAALVFGDTMTPINIVGLFVTLIAIGGYNWLKISKMRQEAQAGVLVGTAGAESSGGSGSGSGSGSNSDSDEGEDIGLLRQSVDEGHDILFTADGGDVVSKPQPSPPLAEQQPRTANYRSEMGDR
ncbi:triose-phosphate transporter family-domain-containing protein [Lasiosphaeria hispida]|uniref:Triose-phosphate transporter family-domain-containing protein n=1 Tax=Lasiosphaeria hispida TaxID=260671 RepID=A0AAJ0HTY5_9PEZI|nr:triose-phosphate transporter family-domain-containing protein [Lasiosphaeria hispida]